MSKRGLAKKDAVWTAAIFLLPLVLSSCGYALRGQGVFLPPHIHKIAVPLFENQALEYRLDVTLNEKIVEQVDRYKGLSVVKEEEADAVLRGVIRAYNLTPLSARSDGTVDSYRVIVWVDAKLMDLSNQETLYEISNEPFQATYPATTNLQDRLALQREAWTIASEDLAKWLVSGMLEGF